MVKRAAKLTRDEKILWTWVSLGATAAAAAQALGASRLPAASLGNWVACVHNPAAEAAQSVCAALLDTASDLPETWLEEPLRRDAAIAYGTGTYDRVVSDVKRLEKLGRAKQLDLNDLASPAISTKTTPPRRPTGLKSNPDSPPCRAISE